MSEKMPVPNDSKSILDSFSELLKKNNSVLWLTQNEHKSVSEDLSKWIADNNKLYVWESEDAKQKSIDTDSIITMQWFSSSSGNFISIAAPTITELLIFSIKIEQV